MPMKRKNKSKRGFIPNHITLKWHSCNINRQRKRNKIAKQSRKRNRK